MQRCKYTSVPFQDSAEERSVWNEDAVSGRLITSTPTTSPEKLGDPIEVLQRLSPSEMVYKFSAFIPSLELRYQVWKGEVVKVSMPA